MNTEECWLVGRLVVWSFGCLVVWSFGRLVVWSFSCLVVWESYLKKGCLRFEEGALKKQNAITDVPS